MARLDDIKASLQRVWDSVRESEAFQQGKSKYDEFDAQTKLYVNLGAAAVGFLIVFLPVFIGIAKVNALKSDLNDREELIGYLQRSGDTIKQLKAQQQASRGEDMNSPLPTFLENISTNAGIDRSKVEIGTEQPGQEDKETKEVLVEVKLNQVNLRQINRLLFQVTDQGSARSLNIKNLTIDTKGDPAGWLDAKFTVAAYNAK